MAESFFTDSDLTGASHEFEATGVNLGQTYKFALNGYITHVRFRATSTLSGGTYSGSLYKVTSSDPPVDSGSGTLYGSANFGALTADAWNTVALSPKVPVIGGATPAVPYRSAVFTSVGRYRALGSFWNVSDIDRGNITGCRDNIGHGDFDNLRNGTYFYAGAVSYPKDNFNSSAYFTDVVFEAASRIRPTLRPELTSDAGLYSFGIDFTVNTPLDIVGVWWYQPSGGTTADVTVRLYNQATEAQLATGSALAASLFVDEWNLIPFAAPYTVATGTTYTAAAETAGRHAYDNTVSLPTVDPTSRVTMTQTRYSSGGGYPSTGWGSGHHGVDIEFVTATAAPYVRPKLLVSRPAVHRASRW